MDFYILLSLIIGLAKTVSSGVISARNAAELKQKLDELRSNAAALQEEYKKIGQAAGTLHNRLLTWKLIFAYLEEIEDKVRDFASFVDTSPKSDDSQQKTGPQQKREALDYWGRLNESVGKLNQVDLNTLYQNTNERSSVNGLISQITKGNAYIGEQCKLLSWSIISEELGKLRGFIGGLQSLGRQAFIPYIT